MPVGFEDDSAYLGPLRGRLLQSVLAVPPAVRYLRDMETFRYVTLLFLVRCRSLALVSVWNPTFFTLLLKRLPEWQERLTSDLAAGALTPPPPLPPPLRNRLAGRIRPNASRAAEVREALRRSAPDERHRRLWPNLRLVSCWTDGPAAPYARRLKQRLPQARLQPKGLLATEGVVSVPLTGRDGAALAIRSHFFEFVPTQKGPPRSAHELRKGHTYEVLLTTGGGLYRYRLRDVVEVVGHWAECPLLRFRGKTDRVSDRFGEKLDGRRVQTLLRDLFRRHDLAPRFAMLACETLSSDAAYVLFIAADAPNRLLKTLEAELEEALQENYQYRYCRDLGQLASARVYRIAGNAQERYLAACRARGQRTGDVKPTSLSSRSGWVEVFPGRLINTPYPE